MDEFCQSKAPLSKQYSNLQSLPKMMSICLWLKKLPNSSRNAYGFHSHSATFDGRVETAETETSFFAASALTLVLPRGSINGNLISFSLSSHAKATPLIKAFLQSLNTLCSSSSPGSTPKSQIAEVSGTSKVISILKTPPRAMNWSRWWGIAGERRLANLQSS